MREVVTKSASPVLAWSQHPCRLFRGKVPLGVQGRLMFAWGSLSSTLPPQILVS